MKTGIKDSLYSDAGITVFPWNLFFSQSHLTNLRKVKKGLVSTEVVISVAGGNEIVSYITTQSAEKMNLLEGSKVYAIVKASEIMVGID